MSGNNITTIVVALIIAIAACEITRSIGNDKDTKSLIDNAIIAHEAQYHRNVEVVK